jgi:hypothetical protein
MKCPHDFIKASPKPHLLDNEGEEIFMKAVSATLEDYEYIQITWDLNDIVGVQPYGYEGVNKHLSCANTRDGGVLVLRMPFSELRQLWLDYCKKAAHDSLTTNNN